MSQRSGKPVQPSSLHTAPWRLLLASLPIEYQLQICHQFVMDHLQPLLLLCLEIHKHHLAAQALRSEPSSPSIQRTSTTTPSSSTESSWIRSSNVQKLSSPAHQRLMETLCVEQNELNRLQLLFRGSGDWSLSHTLASIDVKKHASSFITCNSVTPNGSSTQHSANTLTANSASMPAFTDAPATLFEERPLFAVPFSALMSILSDQLESSQRTLIDQLSSFIDHRECNTASSSSQIIAHSVPTPGTTLTIGVSDGLTMLPLIPTSSERTTLLSSLDAALNIISASTATSFGTAASSSSPHLVQGNTPSSPRSSITDTHSVTFQRTIPSAVITRYSSLVTSRLANSSALLPSFAASSTPNAIDRCVYPHHIPFGFISSQLSSSRTPAPLPLTASVDDWSSCLSRLRANPSTSQDLTSITSVIDHIQSTPITSSSSAPLASSSSAVAVSQLQVQQLQTQSQLQQSAPPSTMLLIDNRHNSSFESHCLHRAITVINCTKSFLNCGVSATTATLHTLTDCVVTVASPIIWIEFVFFLYSRNRFSHSSSSSHTQKLPQYDAFHSLLASSNHCHFNERSTIG